MINLEVRCPFCGAISNIPCDEDALAFPHMDPMTREILVSGMCRACQSSFFEEEDEEDCDGECNTCEHYDCPLITNEDS